jgi:hypothetical protein
MGKTRRKVDPVMRRWLVEVVQTAERKGHTITPPATWLTSDTGGRQIHRYVPRCSCGWYSQANLGTLRQAYRRAFIHVGESLGDAYGEAARASITGHRPYELEELSDQLTELAMGPQA